MILSYLHSELETGGFFGNNIDVKEIFRRVSYFVQLFSVNQEKILV